MLKPFPDTSRFNEQVSISTAREVYRPVAARGSLLYFLVDSLSQLDRVYHFSMAAFVAILRKGQSPMCPLTRTGHVTRQALCTVMSMQQSLRNGWQSPL